MPKFLSFSISCHVSQPITSPFFYHKSPFPDPSCTFPDPFTTPFHDNFPLHFLTIKNNFWLKYGYFSRLVWEWGISSGKCLICHAIPLCTTKHYVGPFMDDFDQCTIDWVIFCAGTVTFIHHTVFSYSMPSMYRNVSVAKTPDNQSRFRSKPFAHSVHQQHTALNEI